MSRFSINCPHCNSLAHVRTSRSVTPLYRDIYFQCEDFVECGHTFKGALSVISTLSASRKPNPKIRLPFGDVRSAPANDDALVEEVEQA
ncbi:MAG: ogr/Delta-like zinc finger family protein [Caulobacter sp.]|nr:ogr/Delta-like zinc finger family protein [Caulobacter sp.]